MSTMLLLAGKLRKTQYTKVTVDVGDYGGLLRTIAWVLSGG
jgi:hypothetical protein